MKTKTSPSHVSSSTAAVVSGFTLGLDLGDRAHHVCVLDATGQIVREASLPNSRPALAELLAEFPHATVALEAGTHSPWISRYLTDCGATVLVANPRKLHAISRCERKCDRRDAQMLARLARVDAALLHPIQHGTAQAQHDLLGLKLRDALVRTRVNLINAVRFTLKSLGHPVRNPSSESFHKMVLADVPADCLPVVQPLLTVLAQVTEQVKGLERVLVQRSKEIIPPRNASSRSLASARSPPCASSSRLATRNVSVVAVMSGLIWACVLAVTKAAAPTSNCASVNVEMVCCADCSSAPRIMFWAPTARPVPCANTANA